MRLGDLWPLAWASSVRKRDRQLDGAIWSMQRLNHSHGTLLLLREACRRLVAEAQDAATRGNNIAAIADVLDYYDRQNHFGEDA